MGHHSRAEYTACSAEARGKYALSAMLRNRFLTIKSEIVPGHKYFTNKFAQRA